LKEVRLDKNEMPYPPPKEVTGAAKEASEDLHRYSPPQKRRLLRELISDYARVPVKHVVLGAGSEFLLREVIQTFSVKRKVVTISPSFFPTLEAAKRYGKELVRIRLTPPEFRLDEDLLLEELTGPSLVILDNPNNPTGQLLVDEETVKAILESEDSLLLIDEAYYEFSEVTFAGLVSKYPNIAITRTFAKGFSLAGARLGYMLGGEDFLEYLSSICTFLSKPSLLAGVKALQAREYVRENVTIIVKERRKLKEGLEKLDVDVYPTETNFLLFHTGLSDLGSKLKSKGVIVDDLSNTWLPGYVRVTVGKPEENGLFLSEIEDMISTLT